MNPAPSGSPHGVTMRATPISLAAVAAFAASATLATPSARAATDPPELASWLINTDGRTGYGGILADVQHVFYSDSFVYVESTGIPAYAIGPWPGNPNTPANQGWRFKIARSPQEAPSPVATPLGQIGLWRNGVVMFNALDARSYLNRGVWHQNAVVAEASGFDACLGHPTGTRIYHHHQNPRCLYSAPDTTVHSPLLGYAFDGYPVYGPDGYANPDGSGGVRRIRTSYRARDITARTTLPDGTVLDPADYGPPVSPTYPLGYYVEDFEFVPDLGDLDQHNGRFAVTPEYPGGTYAYAVTVHADGSSAYPYIVGPRYRGVVVPGNTGPGGGHVTISEPVTEYLPPTGGVTPPGGGEAPAAGPGIRLAGAAAPNPATSTTAVRLSLREPARVRLRLVDIAGRQVRLAGDELLGAGTHSVPLELSGLAPGVYFVEARAGRSVASARVIVVR